MVYLTDVNHLRDDCENWLITRTTSRLDLDALNLKHVPALSPSWTLFQFYQNAVEFNEFSYTWFIGIYAPWFLKDIKNDKEAKDLLNKLYKDSKTKDIGLVCFCSDEKLCHRSIVGGLLLGAKASIDCSEDYLQYWKMYKQV